MAEQLEATAVPSKKKISNEPTQSATKGIVFNIQHFTVHDGPGIRTEIFLKGCPLRCKWCSNPESMKLNQEIGVYASRCIGIDKCGYCLAACPECDKGVFFRNGNTIAGIDRNICTGCMKCADACPANALTSWGELLSVSDVMKEVLADVDFYNKSGGGVTISGGEALVQWRFASEILKQCKSYGIHTCLETALHVNTSIIEKVYPYTDLVITDIKHMDGTRHREYTGVGNALSLNNLIITVEMGKPLILRIPVVPDHNCSEDNIRATADFIVNKLNNKVLQVQLLPYRPLGLEKYDSLGEEYPMDEFTSLDHDLQKKNIEYFADIMKSYGINAVCGAEAKTV